MSMKHRQKSIADHAIAVGLIGLLIVIVVIAILTLLGPATGNVFSNIVMNAGPGIGVPSSSSGDGNAASEPSQVSDTNWAEDMSSVPPGEQMVVKNGEITLLVENTQTAIAQVTQIALDGGGYVLTSQTWSEEQGAGAAITISVEAAEFETAMRRLRDIALEVQSETTSGEDVTAEYVDLESQLRTLEATQDRLRAFLDQAQSVDEALDVSQELTNTEAQIEQVKGRMAYLEGRSAHSRIVVYLSMPIPASPTPTPAPWALEPVFRSAVGVQQGLIHFLAEAVVWLGVVVGPYLLVLAGLFFGVRTIRQHGAASHKHAAPQAVSGED